MLSDGVPQYDRIGLIRSRELGDEVAATLGSKRAMLLRGHGANVADSDVRSATVVACLLEEAADLQLRALAAVGGRARRSCMRLSPKKPRERGPNSTRPGQ